MAKKAVKKTTAKKTVKKSAASKTGLTKPKKLSFKDRLPKNEVEYCELLIFFTKRALTNSMGTVDKGMAGQLARLEAELAILKAK